MPGTTMMTANTHVITQYLFVPTDITIHQPQIFAEVSFQFYILSFEFYTR